MKILELQKPNKDTTFKNLKPLQYPLKHQKMNWIKWVLLDDCGNILKSTLDPCETMQWEKGIY